MMILRTLVLVMCLVVKVSMAVEVEPQLRDVPYAKIADRSLTLDLYLPTGNHERPCPTVVWIHGGAWRSGSKSDVPVKDWLKKGFSIASIDYRLSPEARFPAQIHDIKAAIRFLRAKANDWSLDPQRFIVAGSSAGGHLACLTGVSADVAELEGTVGEHLDKSSHVQAIISFYGASNLQSILSQSTEYGRGVRVPALQLLLGGQPDEKPELARLASPVVHVDSKDPPLWLVHGDADPQMPIAQSQELLERYQQFALPVDFATIPGGKHGGEAFFTSARLDAMADAIARAMVKPAK